MHSYSQLKKMYISIRNFFIHISPVLFSCLRFRCVTVHPSVNKARVFRISSSSLGISFDGPSDLRNPNSYIPFFFTGLSPPGRREMLPVKFNSRNWHLQFFRACVFWGFVFFCTCHQSTETICPSSALWEQGLISD